MPRKKRAAPRGRTRYAWHRRVPWFAIGGAAVVIVAVVFLARSFGVGSPAVGRYVPGGAALQHVPEGQAIAYPSYPPTGGPHWPSPTTWGAHTEAVPDELAVHNLEHGGVVISYNNIPPADLAAVRTLMQTYPRDQYNEVKVVLRPYDKIAPTTMTMTAWDWIDELPRYDDARVRAFLQAHLNKCCEQVP